MEALGHLTWYTIFDTEIDRATLLPRLEQCELADFAPGVIQAGDAFRRATHTLERLRVAQEDATFVNWLVREVRATDAQIVRHLVRETVDAANVRLDYRPVVALTLDKETGAFVTDPLTALATPAETAAADEARTAFGRFRHAYQGRHLRELVLRVLKSVNPVAVRPSGGVYFVPAAGTETLRRLQAFIATLAPSQCWALPVADGGDTRQVLTQALDETVSHSADQVVTTLARLLDRRKTLTLTDQLRAAQEFKRLHTLVTQYQALLDDRLLAAQATLQAADAQMRSLLADPVLPQEVS
jgi:hypothetical protein